MRELETGDYGRGKENAGIQKRRKGRRQRLDKNPLFMTGAGRQLRIIMCKSCGKRDAAGQDVDKHKKLYAKKWSGWSAMKVFDEICGGSGCFAEQKQTIFGAKGDISCGSIVRKAASIAALRVVEMLKRAGLEGFDDMGAGSLFHGGCGGFTGQARTIFRAKVYIVRCSHSRKAASIAKIWTQIFLRGHGFYEQACTNLE